MKFYRLTTLFMAFVISATACAAEVKAAKTNFAAGFFNKWIDSGEYPGAITVLYKDGIQEVSCFGWADVDKKIPISMDQIFMQCSQTKGFCGVTVAILIEEGKISLDDPVYKYLPEYKNLTVRSKDKNGKTITVPAKNTLTVRMVMNHTGGLSFEAPSKSKYGWPAIPLRQAAGESASVPLHFEPGTKEKYSNAGIDVGAAIVEVVTGKSWDIFLKERVLDPLGMTSSTFKPTDEQLANAILLYDIKLGQKAKVRKFHPAMPLPHNGPNVHPSAGAGLWTTANDQLKFYKMLMNLGVGENGVRILKEETVKNLLATSTRPAGMEGYSLGLAVNKDGSFGHGGAWGSVCTVNWQKKQLSLIVIKVLGNYTLMRNNLTHAANKFFAAEIDTSGVDAYTGRME